MKTKCEYSGTLFIISRKYFSVFRGPHLPLDTPFWTRCFPLVMQSRKAGFPFAARARMREPCLQRYVSRMTRTEFFVKLVSEIAVDQRTRTRDQTFDPNCPPVPVVLGCALFSKFLGLNAVLVELDELSSGVPSFLKSDL